MEDERLYGTGDVASATGFPRGSLIYRITNRDLPEASHRVAGRRVFTKENLDQIQAILQTNPELWPHGRIARVSH